MTELADRLGPAGPGADGFAELREWLSSFVGAYRRCGPITRTWSEAPPDDPGILGPGEAMDHSALALVGVVERLTYCVSSRRISVGDGDLLDTLTSITDVGAFGARSGRFSLSR